MIAHVLSDCLRGWCTPIPCERKRQSELKEEEHVRARGRYVIGKYGTCGFVSSDIVG